MLIEYIVFVTSGFKTIHVKNDYGELYTHKFEQSMSLELYHPLSSNIDHCQLLSCVRAWFNDPAEDIVFNQIFLSQSE